MARIRAIVFLILAGAVTPKAVGQPTIDELARLYDYDATQPLDVQQKLIQDRDGVRIYDVTYASPKGGRAMAYLVMPAARGSYAGIVFGHWGLGTRTEFLPEAQQYARAGAVCLLVDYPWDRPEPWRKRLRQVEDPQADHEAYVQAVIDIRRGADLLAARGDVDAKRLAYVGHSYGAQWGAVLSAVEPRLKCAALVGGTPDAAAIWRDSNDPGIIEWRANVPKDKQEAYLKACERTDAIRYVGHARCPLLLQFANFERYFDKPAMDRYAATAPAGKTVKWYDTGHELNDPQALHDRAEWLSERVGLTAPARDGAGTSGAGRVQ
jgi:dienelactone hydrolase